MEPNSPDVPQAAPAPAGRSWVWLWILLLAAAGLAWWHFRPSPAAASAASTPPASAGRSGRGAGAIPVVVATARAGSLPVYLSNIGTITAMNTVTLHTRIAGQILKVNFTEGQFVKAGDVLVEIDPSLYQAALDQANANLAQAQATLLKDEANQANARAEYDRYTQLSQAGVVSREQYDQEKANSQSADAAIAADKANILSDQAAVATAQINVNYCRITSPISGRIGLRQVDPGNFVQPSDATGVAVITQVQPVTAVFNLPQASLNEVDAQLRAHAHLPVEAWDQNNTKKIATGELLAIDSSIDPSTDTYRLKAQFPNQDLALFPNQFVNLRLLESTATGLTLVPSAAIQRGPQGTYVFAVANRKATLKNVDVKLTEGTISGIDTGLAAGEQVVIDGADKLENGTLVNVTTGSGGGKAAATTSASSGGPGSGQ